MDLLILVILANLMILVILMDLVNMVILVILMVLVILVDLVIMVKLVIIVVTVIFDIPPAGRKGRVKKNTATIIELEPTIKFLQIPL